MDVQAATREAAVVSLSRAEVLALRNLSANAHRLPLELRGPQQIFDRLELALGDLAEAMSEAALGTGRPTRAQPPEDLTRDGFGEFVGWVLDDFTSSGRLEWENNTLERFLDGFSAFALARVHGERRDDQERASWALFAQMVVAATGYE